MRLLTKTIAVVSILAPASAYSLGIGEIKLHSALNQNLNAEIALQLSGENISDIKVSLAPPQKFDEAGVAWNYFLSKIKFQTVAQPNGSVVIRLTSSEVLKEPFLDLLLEVTWPKGNLYREFTVLVDPPAVYNQATVPVATPRAQNTTTGPQGQVFRSAQQSDGYSSSDGQSDDEYGPTRKNDTLWRVAEGLSRQQGVSVEQMMLALYQANPNAFYKNNVNALMAGKTLKVPEKEVILKLSRSQALSEFNKQNTAWRNNNVSAPEKQKVEKELVADNQLKLIAPTEDDVSEDALVAPGDQAGAGKKPGSAGKNVNAQVTNTATAEASARDEAVQTKIAALEKQLAVMQQIIALKDQQLAAVQSNAQQPQSKPVAQEPVVTLAPVPTKEVSKPVETIPTQAGSVTESEGSLPQATQAPVVPTKPAVVPTAKPAIAQPVVPTEDSSDWYYWTVGGVGSGIFGVLGWLWWRKRKVEEETSAESMFASSSLIAVTADEDVFSAPSAPDTQAYTVGESSFLSEFTPSDFNSFDTDHGEIDPISEADVYLAYGRYQQAEELIQHAIKDHPDRDECKLKLLEIYYASENKDAFLAYANDLVHLGKNKQADFWAKVSEMGGEICADAPLFSKEEAHFAVDNDIAKDSREEDADDLDFGLVSEEDLTLNAKVKSPQKPKDAELDYDLASFDIEGDAFGDDSNNADIDFDLDSLNDKVVPGLDPESIESDNAPQDFEAYEFNFDSIDLDSKPTTEKTPVVSSSKEKETPVSDLKLDNSISFDNEEFDINFNLEGDDDKFAVSDLTDMDELETKLDLAKAYIDMGDIGAARDIASEVLSKGTDAQKAAAKELLEDLD